MKGENIIEVHNLSKSFKGKKIIEDISFNVKKGDIFGFLGPNGSGKTTTIRMLVNLIYPDGGHITIDGYDLRRDFKNAINVLGAIVETPKFYPYLSGRKNLELMANLSGNVSKGRVDEVLAEVGLKERSKDKVGTYSLGMKQRLGIANALLNNPKIVILDEPTNGLDPQGMKEIRDLVTNLAMEKNITFFISTHLLHEVEMICNRVAILNKGKIIATGKVKELLNINHEIIEVCTSQGEKSIDILNNLEYVKEINKSSRGIMLKIDKGYSYKINKILINNLVDVEYIIPNNQSLESYFINLINGEEN